MLRVGPQPHTSAAGLLDEIRAGRVHSHTNPEGKRKTFSEANVLNFRYFVFSRYSSIAPVFGKKWEQNSALTGVGGALHIAVVRLFLRWWKKYI
ncbi:hypothetical protein EYF80_033061 [Liparis tanakae]|uniref:Uncharacterized protein n=1 Tax=Liparis tanakae TaxID=230148 RepID=A0A4Z2GT79_9TELE|nr:hypothetical protein EYF80_033061 [Liparis tanakae]